MKIDARRKLELKEALQQGGGAARAKQLIEERGVTPAELRQVLDELGDGFDRDERKRLERLLPPRDARAHEPGVVVGPGQRVHEVRAGQEKLWWSGVQADPLPAPSFPEPPRDVEVHGEKFTKQDVLVLLRHVALARSASDE